MLPRNLYLIAFFCCMFVVSVHAQEVLSLEELSPEYEDKEIMVRGKIIEIKHAKQITHLNFDFPYPDNTFEVKIFDDKITLFTDGTDIYKDKTVIVRGKLNFYGGRYSIIIREPSAINIVQEN